MCKFLLKTKKSLLTKASFFSILKIEIYMQIKTYKKKYTKDVTNLILDIQNNESKVNLALEDQPDLIDIEASYIKNGGNFWVAIDKNNTIIGTLGLLKIGSCAVLKKFFISKLHRGQGVSEQLFDNFLNHCKQNKIKTIILDTPYVCKRAQGFYIKSGFKQIQKTKLPIQYPHPDRDSIYFIKHLQ